MERKSLKPILFELYKKYVYFESGVVNNEVSAMELLSRIADLCKLADGIKSIVAVALED